MTKKNKTIDEVRLMTEWYAERISDNWEYFANEGISKEEYLTEAIATITDYFECAHNNEDEYLDI